MNPSTSYSNSINNCVIVDNHQQEMILSTSTTMINSSPPSLTLGTTSSLKQQPIISSVSTSQQQLPYSPHHHNNLSPSFPNCCLTVNNVQSVNSPINNSRPSSLDILSPSSQQHNLLNPFSFNGGSGGSLGRGERDRAISSPPPLAHMKKQSHRNATNGNPSPNSTTGSGSGLTSPNCSDHMNLDDDCLMEQQAICNDEDSTRPRRFSLPSNDLMNMPFFRQKPQNLTSFQLFNPDIPLHEPEIELKDITGMTVFSNADCREQYEMLVEELKEFNVHFSCDNI